MNRIILSLTICAFMLDIYDYRILKLTTKSVVKETEAKDFKRLWINDRKQIMLPKESGYYLFFLRTEKYSEFVLYMGVIGNR